MLKSNPETAQIPVILKMCGQVMAGDREKYLEKSGVDDAILLHAAGWEALVDKIKRNLPADDPRLNTRIDLKNRFSGSQTVKVNTEKESVLFNFITLKIYQILIFTAYLCVYLISAISQRYKSLRKGCK